MGPAKKNISETEEGGENNVEQKNNNEQSGILRESG
jgi:hypothetical protein